MGAAYGTAASLRASPITHVRAEEFSDIRTYSAPQVVHEIMLFGKDPKVAKKSPMLKFLGGGFMQSIDMVADTLGFALDPEKRAIHEIAIATAPIDSPIGTIAPGLVAAQRFAWQGLVRGEPVVTAAVNWFMGDKYLEPLQGGDPTLSWTFGPEGERFEVEITGRSEDPSHVPRLAPGIDRLGTRAQQRHRGDGDALRQRGALCLPGGVGDQDLSRPAAHRRARGGSSGALRESGFGRFLCLSGLQRRALYDLCARRLDDSLGKHDAPVDLARLSPLEVQPVRDTGIAVPEHRVRRRADPMRKAAPC